MRIGPVDTDARVVVMAEIGNNHEGDLDVARSLVRAAADAGADAVKIQAIVPERLQRGDDPARIAQLGRFSLGMEGWRALGALARELGLAYVASVFDAQTLGELAPALDAVKVASGDNDVPALLHAAGATGLPVLISTGMVDAAGAAWAAGQARAAGAPEVALLHCVSAYPTEPTAARLVTLAALRAADPDAVLGYSDHTLGDAACLAATAAGARVLEKHLTLRHDFSDFRDHQLSATPDELAALVQGVRAVETLLGEVKPAVAPEEAAVAAAARRSAVVARNLPAGHVLAEDDVVWLRPGDGVRPARLAQMTGRPLTRDVAAGEALREGDA
jgi:sialic acid synthase SpsE